MKTLKNMFIVVLLLCSVAVCAQEANPSSYTILPKEYVISSSDTPWTSELFEFEEPINGIRVTFFENDSYNRLYEGNGKPMVCLSELSIADAEGNPVAYSVTTNSLELSEGSLEALYDNDINTFYHSVWSDGALLDYGYVYLELTFNEPINSFTYSQTARGGSMPMYPINFCFTNLSETAALTQFEMGNGVVGVLDPGTGVLTISGEGEITNSEIPSFDIREIIIEDGITGIGDYVFAHCTNLTNVTIGNSVTSIGSNAFYNCSALTGTLVIPNSVTRIGGDAFYGCSGLTGLSIGRGVTSIGGRAFNNCLGLRSVEFNAENCTYMGNFSNTVFTFNNTNLSTLTFGENVKNIPDYAFYSCDGLTSVEIPNSVTSIGDYAFCSCDGLTSLTIGAGVTTIGSRAFEGCFGLTGELVIPDAVTSIGDWAFYDCSGLTGELVIPDAVTTIGDVAFYRCSGFTGLTIGNSVTTIGGGAFLGCSGLTGELVIPDDVTTIGNSAFRDCTGLTSVEIGNSVTSIGDETFYGCSGLTGELVIPDAVTSIGRNAFYDCNGFTNVTIGNGVTSIGEFAFYNCQGLTNLTLGSSVETIGSSAFSSCPNLTGELVIPNAVKTIDDYAFYGVRRLKTLTIGSGITSIGESVFNADGGINIVVVKIKADTPPAIGSGNHPSSVIVVPEAAVDVYMNDASWSEYASMITGDGCGVRSVDVTAYEGGSALRGAIGDELTTSVYDLKVKGTINSYDVIILRTKMPLLRYLDLSEAAIVASEFPYYNGHCTSDGEIGDEMFYVTNIACIKLPENTKSIGRFSFANCYNLQAIDIPDEVVIINGAAFQECTGLVELTIGNNVTTIGSTAFNSCSSIKNVTIPSSVKELGNGVFGSCYALQSVSIPNGLISIPADAFSCCTSLKNIALPPTVKRIGECAFNSCSSLEEIRIPSSVEDVAGNAFSGCYELKKVYTYTMEPLAISDGLFPEAASGTLYAPTQSRERYYFAAGWNSFLKYEFFDEPYEYFYVNNDYVLNDGTGYIEGTEGNAPDADINAGGGFIVEGEQGDDETPNQSLGDVNVGSDGNGNSGSIIGDNNLHIDDLHIKINVNGGRWYFFAFPFDIWFDNISMQNGSEYVFRYYDGEERAKKGNGGWKDVNEDHLKSARGYIFQCSANDVLVLNIKDVKFKKEDKYNELVAHVSENLKDASWNFVGNPYLSYYDLADMDYTAPVTVWDGEKYVAIRLSDDDYHFAPYEAFFVQKPEGQESIAYDGEEQMTRNQSNSKKEKQSAARRARGINHDRLLINLVLDNGTSSDRTRIVFNNQQSLAYETTCDASKFETKGVAQLYTIGRDNVHYAINERPADNGVVMLGYTAPTAGFYTIEAQRMDAEVFVKDYKTGELHNLNDGAYSFSTDAGTFNERFEILLKGTAPGTTGIDEVNGENGEVKGDIYDLQGRKMKDTGKGIYIIGGEKILK